VGVSRENVEIVLGLQPPPQMDLVRVFRDERSWATVARRLTQVVAPDCEFVAPGFLDVPDVFEGTDGLREMWLQWLAPWASYRATVEETFDLGDRVALLVRDFGRRAGDANEVAQNGAAVWSVRDGKVVRVEYHADRRAVEQLLADEGATRRP
jgi:ketosteroid isomerase-like protein